MDMGQVLPGGGGSISRSIFQPNNDLVSGF